jgi:hypothetical protein
VILFGTALVMWWNRVLSQMVRSWRRHWASEVAPRRAAPEFELERK